MRNPVLRNRDQAEAPGRQRIADHFDHLDPGALRTPRPLGEHKLAGFCTRKVGNWRGTADPLVNRCEPWLAATVDFDHPHQPRSEEHTSELQSLMRNSYA